MIKQELQRIIRAFFYSRDGLLAAWKDDGAFRTEVILTPFALLLNHSAAGILAWGLVLVTELLNTSIEAAVDLSTKEIHPLAKKAKDAASAAVLVALVVWVATLL